MAFEVRIVFNENEMLLRCEGIKPGEIPNTVVLSGIPDEIEGDTFARVVFLDGARYMNIRETKE